MARYLRALVALATTLAVACTAETPKPKTPAGKTGRTTTTAGELSGPPGLPATSVASLEASDAPVAFALASKGGLFVFVKDGRVFARAVAHGPSASGEAVPLSNVGTLGIAFSVRARPDGTFVVFWAERVDQNHLFKVLHVGPDAKPIGSVISTPPIAESAISFADIAVLGDRVLIVHEVEREDRVSVYVTPISATFDRAEGKPRPVIQDVLAWYPAESESGLAIIAVRPPVDEPDASGTQSGPLDFIHVDAAGVASKPKPVVTTPTVQIDAQIAAVKGGYVVAWTDEGQDDGAVRVATLSKDGAVASAPAWVAPPIGQQAFVSLASDPSGQGQRALVAWENIGQTGGEARVVQLAAIDGKGVVAPERTRLLYGDNDRPALVADGEGFAALTLAPASLRDAPEAEEAPSYPTLVRLGSDLSVSWAEPIRFAEAISRDGVPAYAWNPSCSAGSCYVLAADGDGPASFFIAGSTSRASAWKSPAWRADAETRPKVIALRSVAEGPRFAGAHAARLGDGGSDAIAWVTYFLEGATPEEPAPRGEPPFAATLGVRFTTSDGGLTEPFIVSKRALSLGGVSVAPGLGDKSTEAVIAWVANDKSGPQVYATKVDDSGKKVAQKKVTLVARDTKGKGDKGGAQSLFASSVAVATSPLAKGAKQGSDGYVVAWVDTRDKNGEVYVARLNNDLEKKGADKRVTSAAGDASDLSLAVRGSDAFIAFADEREGKGHDIYFAHLDPFSLKEIDNDGRVYASAGRSRAPRLALAGEHIVLAWIEEDVTEGKPANVRIAEVDPTGRLVQPPRILEAPDRASVTGFTITCETEVSSCRLSLSWASSDGRTEIGAVTLDASGVPSDVRRLGTLASGPFAEPSLSFADRSASSLFYAEDLGNRGRLRKLRLGW